MKRILSLTLALLCLLSLTACRSREERQAIRRQLDYANGTAEIELPQPLATAGGITLDKQVIYDRNGVTVTLMGIYEDGSYYHLPILVENNGIRSVSLWVEDLIVNGWVVSAYFIDTVDVVSGGTDLLDLELHRHSLSQVAEIGRITGSLSLSGDALTEPETISFSVTTSAGEGTNLPLLEAEPVWTDGSLSLYLQGVQQDSFSLTLSFILENSGSEELAFSADDEIRLNGTELSNALYVFNAIPGGTKCSFDLNLAWYQLEEVGIQPETQLSSLAITAELHNQNYDGRSVPVTVDLSSYNLYTPQSAGDWDNFVIDIPDDTAFQDPEAFQDPDE